MKKAILLFLYFIKNPAILAHSIIFMIKAKLVLESPKFEEYKKSNKYRANASLKVWLLPGEYSYYYYSDIIEMLELSGLENAMSMPFSVLSKRFKDKFGYYPKYMEQGNGTRGVCSLTDINCLDDDFDDCENPPEQQYVSSIFLFEHKNYAAYRLLEDSLVISERTLAHEFAHAYLGLPVTHIICSNLLFSRSDAEKFELLNEIISLCFEIFLMEKKFGLCGDDKYACCNDFPRYQGYSSLLYILSIFDPSYKKLYYKKLGFKNRFEMLGFFQGFNSYSRNELKVIYPVVKRLLRNQFEEMYQAYNDYFSNITSLDSGLINIKDFPGVKEIKLQRCLCCL